MSSAYQPFIISEFKTGLFNYQQPWIRPLDAFEPLTNAYIYRGIVNKRAGFSQFGASLSDGNPVMGIMRHIDQTTGVISLLVATTQNLYLYVSGSNSYTLKVLPSGFSGNISNFFNFTNWQETSTSASYLFMTNNVDPVTLWDGTTATQSTLTVDATAQTITNCLDVQVYKQRMLYIRPTLSSDGVQNQSIYWSALSDADNVLNTT